MEREKTLNHALIQFTHLIHTEYKLFPTILPSLIMIYMNVALIMQFGPLLTRSYRQLGAV